MGGLWWIIEVQAKLTINSIGITFGQKMYARANKKAALRKNPQGSFCYKSETQLFHRNIFIDVFATN
jgi:hypothetical protein